MTAHSKITAKGQTTIPVAVRKALKLKAGDRIDYIIRDGKVELIARNRRAVDLAGILYDPKRKPVSIEEMDEAIGDAVAEDDERIMREWRDGIE